MADYVDSLRYIITCVYPLNHSPPSCNYNYMYMYICNMNSQQSHLPRVQGERRREVQSCDWVATFQRRRNHLPPITTVTSTTPHNLPLSLPLFPTPHQYLSYHNTGTYTCIHVITYKYVHVYIQAHTSTLYMHVHIYKLSQSTHTQTHHKIHMYIHILTTHSHTYTTIHV